MVATCYPTGDRMIVSIGTDRLGWEVGSPISEACIAKPTVGTDQFGFAIGNSALRKLSITSSLADQSQM